MQAKERIALIIPALNEEEAIKNVLQEIPADIADWVIVVDNGSTDRTAAIARAAGSTLASEPTRGYGRACFKGFTTALELGADVVVFMDGDGSDDPADLTMMLEPVLVGTADLVMGSRVNAQAEKGAIPAQARLGNWLVSRTISLLYGAPVHDIGSFRVLRSIALKRLDMREMTFGWPVEMLVKAARSHYRIVERPLHYRRRSHGQSKVSGTISGSVKAAYSMLSTTLRYVGAKSFHV
ncbi:MAG TPA: glycosyltransferase family 2 protein [Ktedonobacteraceae bacterium]|nr:glycosyltransferase family 2 protein [Ktedonobacteraceae bacterium]